MTTGDYASRHPDATRARQSRAGIAFLAVALAAIAAVLVAASALSSRPLILLVAAPLVAYAWQLRAQHLTHPDPGAAVTRDKDALVVRVRREYPAAAATSSLTLAGLFFTVAGVLDSTAWLVAGVVGGLALLAGVPDGYLAAARRTGLRITSTGLEYAGWSHTGQVDFDDVEELTYDLAPGRNAIRIRARVGAPSFVRVRRWLIWPFEPRATSDELTITAAALDSPERTFAFLEQLTGLPANARAAHFESYGLTALTGLPSS